jgi:hypothetical protein
LKGGDPVAAEEIHHEILCAVIKAEETDQQPLTAATQHNVPLHIVNVLQHIYAILGVSKGFDQP